MKISFSQIKKYVDGKSFERGQKYYLQSRISFGKYGVDYIEGLCEGSYENYYHVRVYFSKNKIVSSDCSCPIGTGRCKHVVTLMFSWKNKKHIFSEVINLKNLLNQASKTQIIELCLSITKSSPELKNYVETYMMNISETEKEFSTEDYKKRISQSIKSNYMDFNSTKIILDNMELYIKLSDDLIHDGKLFNSINLLNAISFEILDNYEYFNDEEGEVIDVVNDCVEKLSDILDQSDGDNLRKHILEILFSIYLWDVEFGGITIGYEVPEIFHCISNLNEKNYVAGLIDSSVDKLKKNNQLGKWREKELISLKLQLQEEIIDPKSFLKEALKNNNHYLYSRKLIELGEIEEVEKYIAKMEKFEDVFSIIDMISILNTLVENNYPEIAEKIAYERISGKNVRLLEWLKTQYETIIDPTQEIVNKLYTVEKHIFDERPNEENYFNLKEFMSRYELNYSDWEKLQNRLLNSLLELHQYNDLVFIHLREDNTIKAIQSAKLVLNSFDTPFPSYFNYHQLAEVAEQAIPQHIEDSIEIYSGIAERLIEEKNRWSYNTSCDFLLLKKENMIRNNQYAEWMKYIKQLRREKKRFRALIDELDKADVN